MTDPNTEPSDEFPRHVGFNELEEPVYEDRFGNRFAQPPLFDLGNADVVVSFSDDALNEFVASSVADEQDEQWAGYIAEMPPIVLSDQRGPAAPAAGVSSRHSWDVAQLAEWLATDVDDVEALCETLELSRVDFDARDLRSILADFEVDTGPYARPALTDKTDPAAVVLVPMDVAAATLQIDDATFDMLYSRTVNQSGIPHLVMYRFPGAIGERVDVVATRAQLDLGGSTLRDLSAMLDGPARLNEVIRLSDPDAAR